MRAATSNGQVLQAFNQGGKTTILEVGSTWTEFDPDAVDADLFAFFIPAGTRQVFSTSTQDIPDLVPGAQLLPAHRDFMFPHFAGSDIQAFDRDKSKVVRFFFICDPDDATEGATESARMILRQGA